MYLIFNAKVSGNINKRHNETSEDLFIPVEKWLPAQILESKKINPTAHILEIKNATRTFVISFAELYDPLWTAYYTDTRDSDNNYDFKTNIIPLFGVRNSFYINKAVDDILVIEYQPQR